MGLLQLTKTNSTNRTQKNESNKLIVRSANVADRALMHSNLTEKVGAMIIPTKFLDFHQSQQQELLEPAIRTGGPINTSIFMDPTIGAGYKCECNINIPRLDRIPVLPEANLCFKVIISRCQQCQPLEKQSISRASSFEDLPSDKFVQEDSTNRFPLFDEESDTGGQCDENNADLVSTSGLHNWWQNLPAHRQALIIKSHSWSILTSDPTILKNSDLSPVAYSQSEQEEGKKSQIQLEEPRSEECKKQKQRPNLRGSLYLLSKAPRVCNQLTPSPLESDEVDPLLKFSISDPIKSERKDSFPDNSTAVLSLQIAIPQIESIKPQSKPLLSQKESIRLKYLRTRMQSHLKISGESVLTKSLKRLSLNMTNQFEWGLPISNGVQKAKNKEEMYKNLQSLNVDDYWEDNYIKKRNLIESWTLDTIQPLNQTSGSLVNDPEMGWSSMMVQLESFSSKNLTCKKTSNHQKQIKKPLEHLNQSINKPYRRKESSETFRSFGISKKNSRRYTGDELIYKQMTTKRLANKNKIKYKIVERMVSNPLHLLQLTLELEMMRKNKIVSPLKQRSIKLIVERHRITNRKDHEKRREENLKKNRLEKNSSKILNNDRNDQRPGKRGGSSLKFEVFR
ncbi:hypothetical protein BY996DRAFT_1860105 [Phakopsora pachyrhizi]|nr:hypothetical protein BY996DRAFT_1860105 [Phakopsora pachyrhizi]